MLPVAQRQLVEHRDAERLEMLTAYLSGLGFVAVEVDPRGYRRGSLLAQRAERA